MAPVTIKANARAWYDAATGASESTHWVAPPLVDDGTDLYAFLQDTGGSPRLRCYKADSRINPSSWTEQDSSNAPTVTNANYPFIVKRHGTVADVFVFTAATTITHYTFDLSSNVWASGFGNATTVASPKRNLRCARRSDNDLLLFYTSSADPADLGWSRYEGVSWTDAATGLWNSGASAEGSHVCDAQMDSTDRCIVVYVNALADDLEYKTINSSNTVSSAADIETLLASNDQQYLIGGRFSLFDASGTDTIVTAYGNTSPTLFSRNLSGESDAATGNLSAEVSVDVAGGASTFRSAIHTTRLSSTDYCAYFDDATNGSVVYSTRSAGTGAWSGRTAFVTGIATGSTSSAPLGMVVDLLVVGVGLFTVYQDVSNNVVFDFIVPGAVNATGSVATGTHSVSGQSVTAQSGAVGSVANGTHTVTGQAITGTTATPVTGTVATGSHAVTGQVISSTTGVVGSVTAGSRSVTGQSISATTGVVGVVASGTHTVSAQAIAGTAVTATVGAIATGSHTVSGQSITSATGVVGTVASGAHTVSGQSITGSFPVTGSVATGTHAVSGQAITSTTGVVGSLATGAHTVTGQTITAASGVVGVFGTGSHGVSGQSISSSYGTVASITTGSIGVSGQQVSGYFGVVASVSAGSHAVSGQTITSTESFTGTISSGIVFVTGGTLLSTYGVTGEIASGLLSVSGQEIIATLSSPLTVGIGIEVDIYSRDLESDVFNPSDFDSPGRYSESRYDYAVYGSNA